MQRRTTGRPATDGVVIVTGGAKGLGREYCLDLVGRGYRVAVADIAGPGAVVAEITENGGRALDIEADVTSENDSRKMAATVATEWGSITALVNNAGYFTSIVKTPFDELTPKDWQMAFDVNVLGTWLCCKAVYPYMKERRYGKIVNTSSMTVPTGVPGFLHYVSSKAAIVGLTRALARELGEHGIAVNTISPCYIPHDEGYSSRQDPAMGTALMNERAFKREMVPRDLVGTLHYLVGHASDFVTGQNLFVNGGRVFT